ncbi:LLM class flavin-dependent oxidoreductase [Mesorhizobium sp. M7A.F.Ca.US.006.01.1.1]|uniref:LLM class flavin-dependent oxidoreductase n=1 Tax=Mesorhizobium sp. M7A.F.Ca.US.006.01.1.1 TaxID=2496707 RepID=UPI000FCB9AD6|nr:LLM class flavin-dependent oxidoreductase [Mesorhizobium sp. M7A.F.Ca.US.006.01.1.1]RUZ71533.1 LLM class flavin-dependent oxidoreductase [Mesorhizobium sp. M7A.F.Ca.US.006.01.1.1]
MDFGIFNIMQQRDGSRSAKLIYDEAVEQTIVAEQLGFAKAWYAEHHFSNYSLCPSPLMMAAHMAGRTKTIRLGTAVIVAPLYTPARLLAEIGMVDTLSNGRLELGIGTGYQGYEFDRFGVDLAASQEMTGEILDLIELGTTRQAFEYEGRHFSQPRSSVAVKPIQKPLPIWYAGGNPDHLRMVARNDHTLFISGVLGGLSRMVKAREKLEEAAGAEGKDPRNVKVAVARLAFVTKWRKDAEHYLDCARYQQRLAVSLKNRREKVEDDYLIGEQPYDEELGLDRIAANLPVGDVETCVANMVRMIRAMKPVHIMIQTQVGDMDNRKSLESMELWMTEVVPGIMKELGREVQSAA